MPRIIVLDDGRKLLVSDDVARRGVVYTHGRRPFEFSDVFKLEPLEHVPSVAHEIREEDQPR